jgi:MAM domain.
MHLCVNSFGSFLYLFDLFLMQVVLEASVGSTGMSDIAVDDVTFVQGPCPGMLNIRYISSLCILQSIWDLSTC